MRDAAHIRTEVRRERGAEKGHWARGESCASIPLSALSRPTPNRSGVGTRVIRETVIQRGLAVAVGTNDGRAVALEDGTAVRVIHTLACDATVGKGGGTSVGSGAILESRHALVIPAADRLVIVAEVGMQPTLREMSHTLAIGT